MFYMRCLRLMSDIKDIYYGMMLKEPLGICVDKSNWHGWLFSKHPDGAWVSLCKLEDYEVAERKIAELEARADMSKYKAFWNASRLADQQVFENYVWDKQIGKAGGEGKTP